jgi:WD40 repeat protein
MARAVRARPRVLDVTRAGWADQLPADVGAAFDEDLLRLGRREPTARALLTALAWAKGPGLPWESIWVPVARALTPRTGDGTPQLDDDDVRWLLNNAGAYVVEDEGPGQRAAFRPFHDLLGAHLRGEPSAEQMYSDQGAQRDWEHRRRQAEKAITDTLLATVRANGEARRDWIPAHPYLRTYLAQHAAAAGTQTLTALTDDMDFLAVADPVTLSPLLPPAVPELRDTARIYLRARPLLGSDVHANVAYLQEACQALKLTATATEGPRIRPLYRTLLKSARRDDSLLTFTGHDSAEFSVAFGTTADGRLLLACASGSEAEDGTVRLWDPVTGTPAAEPITGNAGPVRSVAFGTTADGRLLLACGSGDDGFEGTVQLWDPLAGTPAAEPLTGNDGPVETVAFGTTTDGRPLLAYNDGFTTRLWDPTAGAPAAEPLSGSTVAFGTTADGRLLLAIGDYPTTRLWDPVTGTPAAEPLSGSPVAFGTTADGRLLLAIYDHQTIRLWDPMTGTPAAQPFDVDTDAWSPVAFGTTADGRLLLAIGSDDGTIRLWDPVTGTPAAEPLIGHTGSVRSVAFGTTPDGRLLLASCGDGTVRLWDPVTTSPAVEPATGESGPVRSVAFGTTADGHPLLASGSSDGTIRLWDPVTGTPAVGELPTIHTRPDAAFGAGWAVAFGTTADGRLLLASCGNDGVRLWDPVTGTPAAEPLTEGDYHTSPVAFGTTPDERLLLAFGSGHGVQVWEPVNRTLVAELPGGYEAVTTVAFGTTADGRLLLASGGTSKVRLWDPVTGTLAAEPLHHEDYVFAVALGTATDGRLLLASGDRGMVRLWDPIAGTPEAEPLGSHTQWVSAVAFGIATDGRLLLASGGDETIQVWDVASKVRIAALRRRSRVWSIAFFGALLAIGDEEGVCVIELDGTYALCRL